MIVDRVSPQRTDIDRRAAGLICTQRDPLVKRPGQGFRFVPLTRVGFSPRGTGNDLVTRDVGHGHRRLAWAVCHWAFEFCGGMTQSRG